MVDGFWMLIVAALIGIPLVVLIGIGVRGLAAVRKLERINLHAGERIEELSRRLQLVEVRLAATTSTVVKGAAARRARPTVATTIRLSDRAPAQAFAGEVSGDAPKLIEVPDLGAIASESDRPSDAERAEGLVRRHADIRELAEAGVSPDLIARRTNRPVGQVELILALQRRLQDQGEAGPHARPE